jgi:hypothetical protein
MGLPAGSLSGVVLTLSPAPRGLLIVFSLINGSETIAPRRMAASRPVQGGRRRHRTSALVLSLARENALE